MPRPSALGSWRDDWPAYLFGFCLLYASWALSVGWNHTLLDVHGFRQTQTALNVEYLLKGSPWLRYETPVLGTPWSVPFEFPLYQWVVALLARVLGTPIVQTGRFVGAAFFLLTLVPLFSLQKTFGITGRARFLLPSLLLVSPIYLFWSRTFLIESTALFLSAAFLALAARWSTEGPPGGRRSLLLAAAMGVLGAMVKVTTFAGFLVAVSAVFVWALPRWKISGGVRLRALTGVAFLVLLPVVAGAAWTRFADATKRKNPLADGVLTSEALATWNFGTLAQKLDGTTWIAFLERTIFHTIGHPAVFFASLGLALFVPAAHRRAYLVCLTLFLAAPAIFTNLHFVHEYYPYASGLFLVAAIAVIVVGTVDGGKVLQTGGLLLMGGALLASTAEYRTVFYRLQTRNRPPDNRLLERVRQVVRPEDVVVIYGMDGSGWNPELPYYLGRRAIMDPRQRSLESPPLATALQNLREEGLHVGAFLACNGARHDPDLLPEAASMFGFGAVPNYSGAACDLYSKPR